MDLRRSHVMSWISLCTPALIFTWQLLWPLVMAAQPLELALDPVRLTSDPPAPTEPWFLHSSDPPPALAHVLSSPADPGSFHFLGSSAAAQRVASPLELTEPLVPFPDVAAEPPPGPDQFAAGLQDAKDQQEALAKPSERPEEDEASSLQMEDLAEPSERPDEDEGSPLQMEALAKPSERPEEDEASSLQMEDLAEPSERPDEDEGSPLQMEAVAKPSERPEEDEASSLQMEALAKPSERPEEDEVSSLQMEALAKPSERPEEVQPTSIQQEAQAQPAQPPEDVEPSFIQQEAPTEAPAFPTIPVSNDIVPGVAGLFQADKSTLPGVTLTPIGVELTIIPEPIKDVESSTVQQEAPTQPPESSPGVLDQTSVHPEVTFSPLGLGEAHHQISPPVTLRSMDLGLSITPEPTEEIKTPSQQEAPSQAPEKTKSSPAQQGSPALPPEPLKEAEPSLTQQGVRAQPSEAPQQSPEPSKEVVVQPPLYQEVTVPTSGQDQAPHSLSPSVPVPPLDLGLIVTAEPTTEAKSSAALTKPTAPSPRHLEVTAPHPEQVQSQHPNLVEVTVQPVDLEVTVTREPESSETLPATTEQNASRHMDICKLCTCTDGTLACVGLRPEQRLRRVPELESHSYNGTFTIVDLQGNSISYIDESIWKSYRWVEKLILSENNLSELHKDSFEGLLSLQYLDLSCNRIESIERCTFEPLPFLQYINLGCNSITELGFGTFQAWHGMQFLHSVILDRNPLTIVEDSYLLKLPALRYLDVGRTQVSLTTVESILMMTLQLEKLILPSRVTCCLCQFKNDIEVVCETVKLHCDTECLTDITHCDEEVSIENAEGSFMKVLQARKKSTSSELTIEPEKPSSDTNGINLSAFRNDQLDFNDENDAISALNYILPYFSQGNLTNVESALLPLIKLLFLNIEDGDMPLSHLTNNARNPSVKPESNDATYKNRLRKLNSLKNLLEAEILEKINEVMKKEKTAMLIHSNLSGPKLKRQIFQKELQTDPPQGYSLAKIQPVRKRLQRVNRVLKGPKGIRKRHFEVAHQSIQRKQNALPIVENTLRVRRLRGPPPGELGQMHRVHRLGKLLENFNTEPSSIKEHDAAVSSTQKQYLMGWPSASIAPKSLSEVKKSKDLSETTFILDEANARVRNMKASKPIPHSRKKHLFHRSHSLVMHKKAKAKMSQEFGKEDSLKRLMIAKRPLISAVRSLINSPAREAFSSSGELTSQENRLPESVSVLETSKEKSTAQIPFQKNISTWKATTPEKTTPEIPPRENVFMPESAVTADNFMPTVNQTHEIQEEYLSVVSDLLSNATTFTSPLFSSPGEQLENQLNQQLQSLIPNNDVRKLIVHVIRTLKMDCSEVSVQLPCARLISRTGLLMKLLSEQQEVKVSKAEWDMDRWKNENYINESTEAQREQKGQEPRERTKEVPGHSYYNKVILAISVTVLVMILLIISCLIVINSHRRKSEGGKEGSSRGFFGFLLCKKCPSEQESQSSFWRKQPLWLRDMYKPLNATQKKNRAQKLRDQDSSDEDETIDEDKGELREVITENSSQ